MKQRARRQIERSLAALASTLALATSCAEEAAPLRAPTAPRAAWVLEPPTLGLGQIARAERVVVTPPHHLPRPFEAPASDGVLELLDVETLPAEQMRDRWVHRTRLRLRARAVGELVWPEATLRIAAPDGSESEIALPELRIEVESILPEYADRSAPFGLRRPPPPNAGRGGWSAVLAGVAATLVVQALLRLVRRQRERAAAARPLEPTAKPTPPWQTAREEIATAEHLSRGDPLAAAHALSPALRRYVAARYGVDTVARTAEELRASEPPFAVRSAWPVFAELVGELDDLRFQLAPRVRQRAKAKLPLWLDKATQLVDSTVPPEHRP